MDIEEMEEENHKFYCQNRTTTGGPPETKADSAEEAWTMQ